MFRSLHAALVTAYLVGGLLLMATTPWQHLAGMLSHGGSTLMEQLHGSADVSATLAEEALSEAEKAAASRQLMLGILLFTFGGFVHAYQRLRDERPVKITVKKRKPQLLYWLEMRL